LKSERDVMMEISEGIKHATQPQMCHRWVLRSHIIYPSQIVSLDDRHPLLKSFQPPWLGHPCSAADAGFYIGTHIALKSAAQVVTVGQHD
jgi:hypothetical protein